MSPPLNIRASKGVPLDDATRKHISERMKRQLTKLGQRALRATVRFEDVNGPKGGVDAICRVKLVLAGRPSVVTEARGTAPREAFDLAAAQAQRAGMKAYDAPRMRARRRPR